MKENKTKKEKMTKKNKCSQTGVQAVEIKINAIEIKIKERKEKAMTIKLVSKQLR